MSTPESVSQAPDAARTDLFGSPQSRLSPDPRRPELSGPLSELGDGTWAPGPPGPMAHVDPPLSPAERDAQNSPAAIGARRAETERRAADAADRARAGLR
jgi:hypothetical protein